MVPRMSSKTSNSIAQVSSPDEIRNVVLVGSSGSGKTTLLEHVLRSRIPGYRGEKDDLERTSQMIVAAIPNGEVVLNLLDAPGHPDFCGSTRRPPSSGTSATVCASPAPSW